MHYRYTIILRKADSSFEVGASLGFGIEQVFLTRAQPVRLRPRRAKRTPI